MMTHSEAGRLGRNSDLQQKINELCAPYRPKILEQRSENGYTYTKYEAAWAENSKTFNRVR